MIKVLNEQQLNEIKSELVTRAEARDDLITLADFAYQLKLHPQRAAHLAKERGIGRQVGGYGSVYVFYPYEAELLRDRPQKGLPGRPKSRRRKSEVD